MDYWLLWERRLAANPGGETVRINPSHRDDAPTVGNCNTGTTNTAARTLCGAHGAPYRYCDQSRPASPNTRKKGFSRESFVL